MDGAQGRTVDRRCSGDPGRDGLSEGVRPPERWAYAASVAPQLAQKRDAGASIAAPQVAHAPLRYFPHDEQNAGSGSGRGPHTSHDRRIARYRRIAASAGSTEPATEGAVTVNGVATWVEPADSATESPRRDRSSTSAERVYSALRDA